MRMSDWSSDVCSSDLGHLSVLRRVVPVKGRRKGSRALGHVYNATRGRASVLRCAAASRSESDDARLGRRRGSRLQSPWRHAHHRSEEHTSELQSLMRTSYADFCLKNKNLHTTTYTSYL